jgi:hypothetical protein
MKCCVILAVLLCSSLSFAADQQASCVIDEKSIVGRSASGVPQVSNLDLIHITCRVPGRAWPADAKPDFGRFALRLKTVAYQIGEDGKKNIVPSFSNVSGGSSCGPPQISGDCVEESLDWYLNIPIDVADAIAELREVDKKLDAERSPTPEERQVGEQHIRELENHPEELAEIVRQYRPGHFVVECRVMAPADRTSGTEIDKPDPDADRLWAVGHVELEILFKGRAFDKLLGNLQQRSSRLK